MADINRDGKPDVVAGRNWYAAPDFVPRPLRPIGEFGRDYSENNGDHVYDVNGDGWIDVIAGSFNPTKVYWFENPKTEGLAFGKQWKAHLLVDTKVASNELTWLRDMDGDGVPEYVVNSWNANNPMMYWKLTRDPKGRATMEKVLVSPKGNGHGMGFGDINGDGREDIAFQDGWYERPMSAGAPWKLHADWKYPGASCPMLILDLNGDGRNDMLRGNGHNFGLYWMEQLPPEGGKTKWREHLIDKSFSQVHALEWADLDGDGQGDLITGKRVRAHSGGDPGAAQAPVLYYYTWDRETLKFTRHLIAHGEVGTGLQIRTADFNGDGKLDIVVPGKSGTFVVFNLGR